jgi:hypothetical protein
MDSLPMDSVSNHTVNLKCFSQEFDKYRSKNSVEKRIITSTTTNFVLSPRILRKFGLQIPLDHPTSATFYSDPEVFTKVIQIYLKAMYSGSEEKGAEP